MEGRKHVAVVGGGVAGLCCAWLLGMRHAVTLYEAEARVGGHSNTVMVPGLPGGLAGVDLAVDTGFIVYNPPSYPNLVALFDHFGVRTQASDMSFAVSLDGGRLEYSGTSLNGLFAQRRNLVRPRFWGMLRDLVRFYRIAPLRLQGLEADGRSLGQFLHDEGFGAAFRDDHLLPMAAAIWSCPAGAVLEHPAAGFIRFCANHGLLKLAGRPVWRTVSGGSAAYVRVLVAAITADGGTVRTDAPVLGVRRGTEGAWLRDAGGEVRYDAVVFATAAERALELLRDADATERSRLEKLRTVISRAVLHEDAGLMPHRRSVWASWNHFGDSRDGSAPCLTYWMNRLQSLPGRELFLTLNPPREPQGGVLYERDYRHPCYDGQTPAAQRAVWAAQGRRNTWFCGAWLGAGFHEDGVQSGLAVAEALGGVARPWHVAWPNGRMPGSVGIERRDVPVREAA